MSLPTVEKIRSRIEQVEHPEMQILLKCSYLFASRISELVSKACPSDNTVARGGTGKDAQRFSFTIGALRSECAAFKLRTAKRGGKERIVCLPLAKQFEPWTQNVYDYYVSRDSNPLFPYTRQRVGQLTREAFKGYTYPIERYVTVKDGVKKVVDEHKRSFRIHALRHLRATELIEVYGFDGIDLSVYGGWTLRSMIGIGGSMERYMHIQWQRYYPKLLKRRI